MEDKWDYQESQLTANFSLVYRVENYIKIKRAGRKIWMITEVMNFITNEWRYF